MEIVLNRPELVAPLMQALGGLDCACTRVAENRCSVSHTPAVDQREAWVELRFFLRAWEHQHERARVVLLSETV